jgi:hypothetical protein
MKTEQPDNHDDALRNVLKEWHPAAVLPPRFQENVWQRIEHAEGQAAPSVWFAVRHWIGTRLPRPAMAAAYVAILLVVGATAGWTQAHRTNARVNNELGERYLNTLDPYQAPRH